MEKLRLRNNGGQTQRRTEVLLGLQMPGLYIQMSIWETITMDGGGFVGCCHAAGIFYWVGAEYFHMPSL